MQPDSARASLFAFLRPWERIFLIVWFVLLIQGPLVIGGIILGGAFGWWNT